MRDYVECQPDLYACVLLSRPGLTTLIYHRHEERLMSRFATAPETDTVYASNCVPRKARLKLISSLGRTQKSLIFLTIDLGLVPPELLFAP